MTLNLTDNKTKLVYVMASYGTSLVGILNTIIGWLHCYQNRPMESYKTQETHYINQISWVTGVCQAWDITQTITTP